ncbi:MAG: hypothetical protein JRE64_19175 [Deltaproteobacteria bacterium]|nr:hypothetical protein [Deltaproteobacteria bacterium]
MEIATIASAISALKGASDLARGLIGSKVDAAVQSKIIELNQLILEAQDQTYASRERLYESEHQVRQLREELENLNVWGEDSKRYALVYPWGNASSVYCLSENQANGEPPHYLCASCFGGKRKSILQEKKDGKGFCVMTCPACRSELATGYRGIGPAQYAEAHSKDS